jgi:hypothetical protein
MDTFWPALLENLRHSHRCAKLRRAAPAIALDLQLRGNVAFRQRATPASR